MSYYDGGSIKMNVFVKLNYTFVLFFSDCNQLFSKFNIKRIRMRQIRRIYTDQRGVLGTALRFFFILGAYLDRRFQFKSNSFRNFSTTCFFISGDNSPNSLHINEVVTVIRRCNRSADETCKPVTLKFLSLLSSITSVSRNS